MKKRVTLLMALGLMLSNNANSQLDEFTTILNPTFSAPEESGFMFFQTPNTYPVGGCFQYYKSSASDDNNDMELISTHTDNLVNMTHYKFQQTYKGLEVEGAGCIEHYDNQGSLIFTNAKHAENLNIDPNPSISIDNVMKLFLNQMPENMDYAWDNPDYEIRIKEEKNDPNATYYPEPELLIALDNLKDVHFNIAGSRYTLAYKIKVVTLNPFVITEYYMNANSGNIFRESKVGIHEDGTAEVYNYGIKPIDSKWYGGFSQHYRLFADDNGHHFEVRKGDNDNEDASWSSLDVHHDNDDVWGDTYLTETSAFYFTQITWDYYESEFSRTGLDDDGIFLEVRTQLQDPNAYFGSDPDVWTVPRITFGKTADGIDYCWDPSIVAHEYTHGITNYTAGLEYKFESGALSESYSDIFGIVIQAKMLDNGNTDWIYGNSVGMTLTPRSFANPNIMGDHYNTSSNSIVFGGGQPDTYNGTYWYNGNDLSIDKGGVHINSGVQNHWFYILSSGDSGTNDIGNTYNISGIGMDKSSQIAYLALTSMLMSTSQYSDSRLATIQAAKALFGECSPEYRSTIDAWYAVGLGSINSCPPLSINEVESMIKIYPNPANSFFSIETGNQIDGEILIFDIHGRQLKTINPNSTKNIDISEFSNGVYTVVFSIKGKQINKKIIIQ